MLKSSDFRIFQTMYKSKKVSQGEATSTRSKVDYTDVVAFSYWPSENHRFQVSKTISGCKIMHFSMYC